MCVCVCMCMCVYVYVCVCVLVCIHVLCVWRFPLRQNKNQLCMGISTSQRGLGTGNSVMSIHSGWFTLIRGGSICLIKGESLLNVGLAVSY